MTIVPMATTVAGDDPDKAANSISKNACYRKPSEKCPTTAIEKRIILLATPPVDMNEDARIKNGMANSV